MLVNVRQLQAGTLSGKEALEISYSLDLSAVLLWGRSPFNGPVQIRGTLQNRAEILTLTYTADYAMTAPCARCLEEVTQERSYFAEHTVVESVQDETDEDAYALAPDGMLDVDALVAADLSLSLEGVTLCGENCKGLCPRCGKNRNHGSCACPQKDPDPRFDALRKKMV